MDIIMEGGNKQKQGVIQYFQCLYVVFSLSNLKQI
jgi:hypothetical protein